MRYKYITKIENKFDKKKTPEGLLSKKNKKCLSNSRAFESPLPDKDPRNSGDFSFLRHSACKNVVKIFGSSKKLRIFAARLGKASFSCAEFSSLTILKE